MAPKRQHALAAALLGWTWLHACLGVHGAGQLPTPEPTDSTTEINLQNSGYTGTIPSQYGLLTKVTYFSLTSNELTGRLPSELGLMESCVTFQVDYNALSGPIPTEIFSLSNLGSLFYMNDNSFTSQLPSEIGQLTKLSRTIRLFRISLSGTAPTQLGSLTQISYGYDFYPQSITGVIPTELGRLTIMTEYLHFHDTLATGSLPTEIGRLTGITKGLYFYSNQLCSDVPTEVQALSSTVTAHYQVTSGNFFGTPCCETLPDAYTCTPTAMPTISTPPSPLPTPLPAPQPTRVTELPTPLPTPLPSPLPTPAPTPLCGRGEFLHRGACQPCEAGKYRNETLPPAVCTLCAAGTYRGYSTDPSEAEACEACPSGKLSAADRSECTECSAGEYALNDTSCESCEAGKYAPTALTDACLSCAAGSATGVSLAATSCESCDAGTFSTVNSVNCSTCPAGAYSTTRSESCTNCSAGFFSEGAGASSCTACAAGYFSADVGAFNCSACGVGTHQAATSQASCDDCEAGKFADATGASLCSSCDAGTFSNMSAPVCEDCAPGKASASGASSCTNCLAGRYSEFQGASSCTACAAGFVRLSVGASNCSACAQGTFQSATGQETCDACEAGKFADVTGASSCSDCGAGTFSNDTVGASSCSDCAPGKSSSTGAASCEACDSGKFSDATTGFACESCDAGTFSSGGASACVNCSAGTYSSTGASKCTDCSEGYFTAKPGQATCLKCSSEEGIEYTSSEGSSGCDVCKRGSYMDTDGKCVKCTEEGLDCSERGMTLAGLEIRPGYYRFTDTSTIVYECPYWSNCAGGNSTRNALRCAEGANGPLCAVCRKGYYMDTLARTCQDCKAVDKSNSFGLFFVGVVFCGFLFALYKAWRWWKKHKERLEREVDFYFAGEAIGVFIKTAQSLTLLIHNHEDAGGEDPPQTYAEYMAIFSFVDFDFLSWMPGLGCAFEGFEFDLFFHTGVLVLFIGGSVALWLRKAKSKRKTSAWKKLKFMIWVCKLVLPAVSQTVFKTFRCQSYDNNEYRYLLVDQSIDCRSEYYYAVATYAALMVLVFPFGMPVVALVALLRLRPYFAEMQGDNVNLRRTDHPVLSVSPWSSLFKAYRPSFAAWYEVLDMVRRLALTCGTLLFLSVNQFVLFSTSVAFLAATVHEHMQPYGLPSLNSLVSVEHAQSMMCILVLLIRDADMFEGSSFAIVGGVLMATNLTMICVIVWSVLPTPDQLRHAAFVARTHVFTWQADAEGKAESMSADGSSGEFELREVKRRSGSASSDESPANPLHESRGSTNGTHVLLAAERCSDPKVAEVQVQAGLECVVGFGSAAETPEETTVAEAKAETEGVEV